MRGVCKYRYPCGCKTVMLRFCGRAYRSIVFTHPRIFLGSSIIRCFQLAAVFFGEVLQRLLSSRLQCSDRHPVSFSIRINKVRSSSCSFGLLSKHSPAILRAGTPIMIKILSPTCSRVIIPQMEAAERDCWFSDWPDWSALASREIAK